MDVSLRLLLEQAFSISQLQLFGVSIGCGTPQPIPNYNKHKLEHLDITLSIELPEPNAYSDLVSVKDPSFGKFGATILCASLYDAEQYIKDPCNKRLLRHPWCNGMYYYYTQEEDLQGYAEWFKWIKSNRINCYAYPY